MINHRQNRINNPKEIDFEYIDTELRDGKDVIVQFSDSAFSNTILFQLDKLCEKYDSRFGVRFYGNYSGSFDFKTLLKIPHVKYLSVDCMINAHNTLIIEELQS